MKKQKQSEHVIFLRGKKVIMRPLKGSDIPLLERWVNDPEVRQFVSRIFPASVGEERDWIESMSKRSDKEVVLMIEVKGVPIGTMGIHNIDWHNRIGTTGAIIGEKAYWGKGYGTDAKMALLKYAFDTLNLRKMLSFVKDFNKRSIAYSLHCGYKVEGRQHQYHFHDGKYYDNVLLGVFREEWFPHWKKYMSTK